MDPEQCPACGGAGGGPFGRAGSAWDDDDYVCPRCEGRGVIVAIETRASDPPRPGIAKTQPTPVEQAEKAKRARRA